MHESVQSISAFSCRASLQGHLSKRSKYLIYAHKCEHYTCKQNWIRKTWSNTLIKRFDDLLCFLPLEAWLDIRSYLWNRSKLHSRDNQYEQGDLNWPLFTFIKHYRYLLVIYFVQCRQLPFIIWSLYVHRSPAPLYKVICIFQRSN